MTEHAKSAKRRAADLSARALRLSGQLGDREDRAKYLHDLRRYLIGFVSAIVLTGVPFALVAFGGLSTVATLWVVVGCAVVQVVVHFHYFLHIDLQKSHRDDLQLILFTGLIIVLMVAGTIWILSDLHERMMPG